MIYEFNKSLGKLSQQVSKALGKRLEEKFRKAGTGINGAEWSILSMLTHTGCTTQLSIGTTLEMDKVTLTRAISSLEGMSLLRRSPSKEDRRINDIRLTRDGQRIYSRLAPLAKETLRDAFKGISHQEASQLMNLLERVYYNLNHL